MPARTPLVNRRKHAAPAPVNQEDTTAVDKSIDQNAMETDIATQNGAMEVEVPVGENPPASPEHHEADDTESSEEDAEEVQPSVDPVVAVQSEPLREQPAVAVNAKGYPVQGGKSGIRMVSSPISSPPRDESSESETEDFHDMVEAPRAPVQEIVRAEPERVSNVTAAQSAKKHKRKGSNPEKRGKTGGKTTPGVRKTTGGKSPRSEQGGKPKKPSKLVMKEIRTLQLSTKLVIPKLPFRRFIREILQKLNTDATQFRITEAALEAIQEATESHLVDLFGTAYLCAAHARRRTLMPSDLRLAQRISENKSARGHMFAIRG